MSSDRAAAAARLPLRAPGRRLTRAEFDLLACFVVRPRRVLSRDQLLDWTRGRDADPFDRTIDVQVRRLRLKVESDPSSPMLIVTERGAGYELACDVETLY